MMWTLGFIVTFVIGGMTGVLLAVPPVDFMMHNTTFLVAHFHNMLIPGALFGYFAGYQYWFPKAFGFRLEDRWGRRAFWAWLIGFYLAFMPLYVLGLMGMPRRMEHYDVAAWQPWLVVAALGALSILFGLVCLALQLAVSIRDRAALRVESGDPWNGRTLEWATASPPAPYNFAVIPQVDGIDAFWTMKQSDEVTGPATPVDDIVMPDDTAAGVVLGALSFVLAFAMIWFIWWLAILAGIGILTVLLGRTFVDDAEHRIPAAEIRRIEDSRAAPHGGAA